MQGSTPDDINSSTPKATLSLIKDESGTQEDFDHFGESFYGFKEVSIEDTTSMQTAMGTLQTVVVLLIFPAVTILWLVLAGYIVSSLRISELAQDTFSAAGLTAAPKDLLLKFWNLDSGATVHCCPNIRYFTEGSIDFNNNPTAKAVSSERTTAAGVGSMRFCVTTDEGLVEPIILTNVWYLPNTPFNLLSFSKLVDAGMSIDLMNKKVTIDNKQFTISREQNLY
jgi:hypothetical protein